MEFTRPTPPVATKELSHIFYCLMMNILLYVCMYVRILAYDYYGQGSNNAPGRPSSSTSQSSIRRQHVAAPVAPCRQRGSCRPTHHHLAPALVVFASTRRTATAALHQDFHQNHHQHARSEYKAYSSIRRTVIYTHTPGCACQRRCADKLSHTSLLQ